MTQVQRQREEIHRFARFVSERIEAGEPEESVLARYPRLAAMLTAWRQTGNPTAPTPIDFKLRASGEA